jgi:hypothetical protein
LQAAIVTLTARHRISRRGIAELARDLFGATLSAGSMDAICQRASEALAGPYLQLQDWVLDQSAVHVDETGVEPTNNPAERALRGPVIHRKLSLGTQSDDGERFAERALSAAATCRMQHRSLFTYLSELLAAHNRGDPFPALT